MGNGTQNCHLKYQFFLDFPDGDINILILWKCQPGPQKSFLCFNFSFEFVKNEMKFIFDSNAFFWGSFQFLCKSCVNPSKMGIGTENYNLNFFF